MVLIRKEIGCNMPRSKKNFSGGTMVLHPGQTVKGSFYWEKKNYAVPLRL